VADVDTAAREAAALGARVLVEPLDVMGEGRLAVLLDPAGAVLDLWQPAGLAGAEVVNQPGAWCWNTLAVPDLEPVRPFYSELLGWSFEAATSESWVITLDGERMGGVQALPPGAGIPPNWSIAFAVEDIEDAHDRAVRGGGRELVAPQPVVVGRYSLLLDPQGAAFGLYAGQLDP